MKTILPQFIVNDINQYIADNYEEYRNLGQVDDNPEIVTGVWHDIIDIHNCTILFRRCSPIQINTLPAVYWRLISSKTLPTVEITTKGGCLVGVKADCHMQVRYIDLDEENCNSTFNAEFVNKL